MEDRMLFANRFVGKLLIAALLLGPLTSVALWAQPATQQSDQGRANPASTVPASERITREVRHELLLLPRYTLFDFLAFKVEGDKVTLMGQVTKPIIKSDAEAAVKQVEGVKAVDNQIEVLPLSPMDDRIRRAQYRAIYGFGGLYRYALGPYPSIHIIVRNGHVTLEGWVDSEMDRNMAGIRAKTVPGVFSVTNNLQVTEAPTA